MRRELRDLDKRSIPGFKLGVLVEFKDLSFHVHAPGDLSDEEMDEVGYVNSEIFNIHVQGSCLLSLSTKLEKLLLSRLGNRY